MNQNEVFNKLYALLPTFVRRALETEFIKYAISGVIAFSADFAVLIIATEKLGVHYLISNIAAYGTGLIVSYTLNIRFVFSNRKFGHKQPLEFLYFVMIVFVGLGISELAMYLITENAGVNYLWAKVASVVFVFAFNYAAKKTLLFPTRIKTESITDDRNG